MPVYSLGRRADGRPYYAMRFVKGDSLKEASDEFHGRDVRRTATRASVAGDRGGCSGGSSTSATRSPTRNSRGVLHRDIKPANLLLGPYGETLVVDWGLAKIVGRPEPEGSRPARPRPRSCRPPAASAETVDGSALGTPAYMSPEQAAGELDRLGPATDVYSLGATLYYVLDGEAAIRGERRGRGPPEGAAGRLPAAPARQARRARARSRPSAIKAMALDPEDRYADGQGPGRRRGALAGRRAGLGLGRAPIRPAYAAG